MISHIWTAGLPLSIGRQSVGEASFGRLARGTAYISRQRRGRMRLGAMLAGCGAVSAQRNHDGENEHRCLSQHLAPTCASTASEMRVRRMSSKPVPEFRTTLKSWRM